MDVPNRDYKLTPGMYADVSLRIQNDPNALTLPTAGDQPKRGQDYCAFGRLCKTMWRSARSIPESKAPIGSRYCPG